MCNIECDFFLFSFYRERTIFIPLRFFLINRGFCATTTRVFVARRGQFYSNLKRERKRDRPPCKSIEFFSRPIKFYTTLSIWGDLSPSARRFFSPIFRFRNCLSIFAPLARISPSSLLVIILFDAF